MLYWKPKGCFDTFIMKKNFQVENFFWNIPPSVTHDIYKHRVTHEGLIRPGTDILYNRISAFYLQ